MINMSKIRKGASIIEMLIAIFVIIAGFLVVISVLAMSFRFSAQSRHRTYAYIVGNSMLERIREHRYGEPAPSSWTTPERPRIALEGNATTLITDFNKEITYSNGSFVGLSSNDTDVITIKIKWVEGTGVGSKQVAKELIFKTEVIKNEPSEL